MAPESFLLGYTYISVQLPRTKSQSKESVHPKMLHAVIFLLFILFIVFCIYNSLKPVDFPPGPKWLPLVGCFPTFQKLRSKHGYIYMAFQEMMQTYGPILGVKLGNQKIVVISSYDLVKKVLLQEEFNGRPDGFFFRVRAFGKRKGVLFTEGPTWSQCRRFTMRHLRTFGLGQSTMTNQLEVEAKNLVNYLERASQIGPVAMHTAFDIAVLNSLWCMFAGHRFDYQDEKLNDMLVVVHDAFRMMDTMGGIVTQMPFLRFIIPELSGYNELMRILQKLWNFLDEEIHDHEKRLSSDKPQDLIDTFLLEISSNTDDNNDTIFDRENLLVLCLDLFLAGSKTTTDTLATIFQFLSLHPEWFKILQDELDRVVGQTRLPTLNDCPSLPMIEAFLAEVQRYLILAPLGVPHKTMKDVRLDGYRIPKDTIVLLDFHSVHNDQKYWDHPEEFRPQRFLDEEGRFIQKNASVPFGLGKRRCLGEMLARSSLFLFFVYVIYHFDFQLSPEHGKPDPSSYDGFTLSPKPYYLNLRMRPRVTNVKTKDT